MSLSMIFNQAPEINNPVFPIFVQIAIEFVELYADR